MSVKSFFCNKITRNILGGAVLIFALVIAGSILLNVATKHNKEITVPDLTNMSVDEASKTLEAAMMRADVVDSVYVKRMGKGLVYRQNPKPGSKVKEGRRVQLTINAVNAKKVSMPNLIGYSTRQAKAEILSKGIALGKLIYVNDIATNNVLRQLYNNSEIAPGTLIESGSAIDLVVGLNSSDNTTYAPYIVGMKYLNSMEAVHDNSLNIGKITFDSTVKDYSDSLNAVVYRQMPEASEDYPLPMGSSVSIWLTTDKNKVPARPAPETGTEKAKNGTGK